MTRTYPAAAPWLASGSGRGATKAASKRYRVEYRLGGRGARDPLRRLLHDEAARRTIRAAFVAGELAALPRPRPRLSPRAADGADVREAAEALAGRRASTSPQSTRDQHRIQLDKLLPLIGDRRIDTLDRAGLHRRRRAAARRTATARETIRKTLGAGAMVLDHAGVDPNPARDRSIKLPREEPEEINPPSADARRGRLPAASRRSTGCRCSGSTGRAPASSSVDLTLVGDYDEPRRRVRLRAATTKTRRALWVELPDGARRRDRGDARRRARIATPTRGCSPSPAPTRSGRRSRRRAGRPGSRSFSPHDLRHRRISLLHLRGVPWARIGEFVGQRDLTVTANTYTHVLVDETELDYAALLR